MADKKKNGQFGFGVNNCPIWLFKSMDAESKSYHNDQYWVTLSEWYRKALAYDRWMEGHTAIPVIPEEKTQENDEREIKTLGR